MINHQPLFSIVTPSYNQLDWLRLCVASVRDQVDVSTNGIQNQKSGVLPVAVEHIIQDAGSPGIEDFASEVGANFYRDGQLISYCPFSIPNYSLTIYCERDEGMYDAINQGVARSSGEICAWLNSDEQYLEGTLAAVAIYFRSNHPPDVVLGDAVLVDAELRPVCYRRIMVPNRWHTRLVHLHSLSCAMFFQRSALPSLPFDPRWKIIGDAVLMDYFLCAKKKISTCNELLSVYAFTGSNLSGKHAAQEHDAWHSESPWPPKFLRPLVILYNRIRRLASGGYSSFHVNTAFYGHRSNKQRLPVSAVLSGRWP